MNDLFSSEKLNNLLTDVSGFVRSKLDPLEPMLMRQEFAALEQKLEPLREQVKASGWWAPHIAKEHGGMGLDLMEFAQLSEVLGSSPFGHYVFNCQAPDAGNMELLLHYSTPSIKSRFMEPLLQGKIRSCFSMTEPEHAGSNPIYMSTTAIRDGNEYVINGRKWFTTSADGASFAIVMALTDPENTNPYARASMIIVPTDTPGFELVRNIPIMGEAGEGYFSHGEIQYTDCRVPLENLLGPEGSGFRLAQERLGPGRIHHCMRWIGICNRALDLMCRRAVARELKPGMALDQMQAIQHWIAESRAGIMASRLMVLNTAWKMQQEGSKAVKEDISTIKFYVAGVLQQILDRAVQVHGALGITDDTILSFWYRHERGARIYDGPDEVHKSVLARAILKKYRQA